MFFKPVHLDFDFAPLLNANYDDSMSSCIKHQTYELSDIHKEFGGFPKSYCLENTKIYQLWWSNDQIDFDDLGRQMGMEVVTVSTIRQPPGSVIPYHRDTFFQIGKRYPDRTDLKVRANIYLEDYKMGQFIQYNTTGIYETSTNWKSGEGFIWDSEVLHVSANAGFQDKYTMQISGFLQS